MVKVNVKKRKITSFFLAVSMLLSTIPVIAENETVTDLSLQEIKQKMLEKAQTEGVELDISERYTEDVEATQEPYCSESIVHEETVAHDIEIDDELKNQVDRSGISMFSLSDDDYDELWNGLFSNYFGSDYLSPYKNTGDSRKIEGDTNRLVIQETDLALPGKNGLDVNITRKYDNQYYNKIMSSNDLGSSTEFDVYFYAVGYTNEDTQKDIYVLFYSEDEYYMYMENGITISSLPTSYTTTKVNGKTVYCYLFNSIYAKKDDSGDITLTRNKNLPDDESFAYEIKNRYMLNDRKLLPRRNTLGNGWQLLFPEAYLYKYEYENDTDGYPKIYNGEYIGAFRDIDGTVYALEGNGTFKKYSDGTTSYKSSFSARSNKYLACEVFIQTQTIENTDIEYNFIITDNRGLTYYFISPDISESKVNSRQAMYVTAVKDNYGNMLRYEYDDSYAVSKIIDTYGREIEILGQDASTIVSYYDDISGSWESVRYECETLSPDSLNNDSLLKGKNVKRFKVTNAENEQTIYDARETQIINYRTISNNKELNRILSLGKNTCFETSTGYNIERIQYPTGAESRYSYQYIYPLNLSGNACHGVYSVAESSDTVSGVKSNIKNYDLQLDSSWNMVVTATNVSGGEVSIDTYNDEGLLETSVSSENGKTSSSPYVKTTNTYDDNNNIKKQVVDNDGILNTTEYTYNADYPNSLKSMTTDREKVEYIYHTANNNLTDIPKKTQYSYLSENKYVNDYYIETTLNSNNAVEYTRTIQNDKIRSQMQYSYDNYGRVNGTTQWVSSSVNDGVLDEYDDYVHTIAWNEDTQNKTLHSGIYLPDITDADGNTDDYITKSYKFNVYGYPYEYYDGNGNVSKIEYDALARPVKYTYANAATSTIEYNTAQNYTVLTDANGVRYKYIYDDLGKIKEKQIYSSGWNTLEQYTYDTVGRISSTKKYRNTFNYTQENYTYDVLNRVTLKSVYDGEVKLYDEEYTYTTSNSQLIVTKTVTAADNTSSATEKSYYDKYGNLTKTEAISDDMTITNQFTYDYKGNVLTKTEPSGRVWTYEYDLNNNLTFEYDDSLNEYNMYAYDLAGRMRACYNSYSGFSYYTHDEANRVIQTETPFDGSAKQYVQNFYDANSNIIKKKVSDNAVSDYSNVTYNATNYTYDSMNNLVGTTVNNESVQYWYDAGNRVIAMATGLDSVNKNVTIPTSGSVFKYEYDEMGYLSKETDALGKSVTYKNSISGAVEQKTDRNGTLTENEYGPYGVLSSMIYNADKDEEEDYYYKYDNLGRMKNIMLLNDWEVSDYANYTYDSFGRVTLEQDNSNVTNAYAYDESSNITRYIMTMSGSIKTDISYTYSTDNLLTKQTIGDTIISYQYNENRNITKKTIGDYVTNITYNDAGLPKSYVTANSGVTYGSFAYKYRTDGNRISEYDTINDVSKQYTYDDSGRLSVEQISGTVNRTSQYTYDKRGNRIGENVSGDENYTYINTYDNNNRLLTSLEDKGTMYEGVSYAYDNNGNRTLKKQVVAGDIYADTEAVKSKERYSYTVTDKLKTYQNTADGTSTNYTYNVTGMRKSKTVDGTTTGYIWNGSNMVAETNGSNIIQNQYHYGADGITSANINGTELYYLKDGHGNVMRTVEPDGTPDNYYIYDAFGNVLEKDYDDVNPFGYCGEYLDSESGLVYLRNRYYDTTTGQFITEDPIKDGLNWYSYCGGDPVMFVDSSGLSITLSDITSKDDARFVALQNLTDDTLDVDFETGIVSYAEEKSIDREVSTNLIRDVINDDMDCEIIIYDESNGKTKYTCDSESNVIRTHVYFNPDYTPSQWAYVDGEGYGNRTKPNFMVMGHELVHVVRRMQGEERDRSNSGYYLGGPEPGETLLRKGKPEELETTGIDYVKVIDGDWTNTTQVEASKFYYSENTLRLEYDRVHQNDYGYVKMGRRAAY